MALPWIEWVNIQMLATEVTENTEVLSACRYTAPANERELLKTNYPQMNTDIKKLKNAFIRVHLRLSVDIYPDFPSWRPAVQ